MKAFKTHIVPKKGFENVSHGEAPQHFKGLQIPSEIWSGLSKSFGFYHTSYTIRIILKVYFEDHHSSCNIQIKILWVLFKYKLKFLTVTVKKYAHFCFKVPQLWTYLCCQNLQAFFCNKSKQKSSSSGSEDQRFWEVPEKEWLTDLLRKRCNTQLLNIRNNWTKEVLADGTHHMLISIKKPQSLFWCRVGAIFILYLSTNLLYLLLYFKIYSCLKNIQGFVLLFMSCFRYRRKIAKFIYCVYN